MRIGILGSGSMGSALGGRWSGLGHEVCVAGRTPERAAELARGLGPSARSGTLREAVAFADVVLLAVRYEGALSTLLEAGAADGAFVGKLVIDCNNAVETETFTMATGGGWSLAEQIAQTARGASVVKAFHLCQASVWTMAPPVFDGRPLSVPICGNEAAAKERVAGLIREMGCLPVDLGPLSQARNLEPMAAVIIKLLFSGVHPSTNFNLVDAR
jgi:hypothetical protein